MSTIRSTVSEFIPSGYESVAEQAIAALEARESDIVERATEVAYANGLNTAQATDLLEQVGLLEPAPEPVVEPVVEAAPEGTDLSALTALVTRIGEQVDRLTAAAARAGVSV